MLPHLLVLEYVQRDGVHLANPDAPEDLAAGIEQAGTVFRLETHLAGDPARPDEHRRLRVAQVDVGDQGVRHGEPDGPGLAGRLERQRRTGQQGERPAPGANPFPRLPARQAGVPRHKPERPGGGGDDGQWGSKQTAWHCGGQGHRRVLHKNKGLRAAGYRRLHWAHRRGLRDVETIPQMAPAPDPHLKLQISCTFNSLRVSCSSCQPPGPVELDSAPHRWKEGNTGRKGVPKRKMLTTRGR